MDEARARVVGGAVTGRVVDGRGLPRPGVWVYAHPFQGARFGDAVGVHTRVDGTWSLPLLAGRWQVRQPGQAPEEVTVGGGSVALAGSVTAAVGDPGAAVVALLQRRESRDAGEQSPSGEDTVAALLTRRGARAMVAPQPSDTDDADVVGELVRRRSARAVDTSPAEHKESAAALLTRRRERRTEATSLEDAPSSAVSVARLLARRHTEE